MRAAVWMTRVLFGLLVVWLVFRPLTSREIHMLAAFAGGGPVLGVPWGLLCVRVGNWLSRRR